MKKNMDSRYDLLQNKRRLGVMTKDDEQELMEICTVMLFYLMETPEIIEMLKRLANR